MKENIWEELAKKWRKKAILNDPKSLYEERKQNIEANPEKYQSVFNNPLEENWLEDDFEDY